MTWKEKAILKQEEYDELSVMASASWERSEKLHAENARLRAVVEAAVAVKFGRGLNPHGDLIAAVDAYLAELDKAGG